MLKIKNFTGRSGVHGTGLFAGEFIPKGTVTWSYDPKFDISFTQEEVDLLPEIQKNYILYYAYLDKDINKLVLCADNQRYINHSKNTNIESTPRQDIASRDIQEGEELLCDYNKFDNTYFSRMNLIEEELN
ncbi:SET domain-containing protein [Candidatus Nomurabacteria bacterium]|nr:SET domain-containing protein [Candidatus Nomurabacteria bacterium]